MAKVKERKSESWKPGVHHDDGFISKNKKRKEKRMSLNLSAKKIDTDEFIPVKKSFLALNKSKEGMKTPNKFLSPALDKKFTPKKKDTPLPALGGKKQTSESTPNARKFSLADTKSAISQMLNGTPKVKKEPAGTPKMKAEPASTPKTKPEFTGSPKKKLIAMGTAKLNFEPVIKSSLKKKAQKFIDHEAEECEEPITDKVVKPYVKGQKRKSISFKFNDENESENDSDDSDDSEEMSSARDFLDSEASEGEETDDSDIDDEEGTEDDDDDNTSDLLADDDDDDLSDEEDSDDDEDDDERNEQNSDDSDEEEQLPKLQANKKPDNNKTKMKKNDVEKDSDDEVEENLSKLNPKPASQMKKEKTEKTPKVNEPLVKKSKVENNVAQKPIKEENKPKEKKDDATSPVISEYAGYIKYLPRSITADQIKSQLGTVISPKNIVSIVLKKNNTKNSNKCLVYVTDEDSLDKLENKTYTIGKNNFKVYKARESKKPEKTEPIAFLPRVPLSIDDDKVQSIIEADIGAGKIKKLKSKKVIDKLKTRNVIIEVADEETLKKMIYKGSYTYNGTEIVVRQAFESGIQIPIYRIVFSGIPENTTEAIIKNAVEIKVGKGSVASVKFSFRKSSFAFVTLNNESALKKLLDPSFKISVNGTKLEILEFKPRLPRKKRGPSKKKVKEAPPAKKQKVEQQLSTEAEPKKPKNKNKTSNVATGAASPAKNQQNSQQQKKPKQQTQNSVQSFSQQNAISKKQKQQQQPGATSTSPSSPKKNKKAKKAQNQNQVPDKKTNLNNKLEAKKEKLKNKKNKNKQADISN